jgi:hypothetical protein
MHPVIMQQLAADHLRVMYAKAAQRATRAPDRGH